ncbi:MAG: hypothetical protein ACLRJC_02270 [Emergencia timonensis]|uniref:hypothetical protein n=1 Tax=Emergencia timonensis TaxID=1776384 RepID=UPI000829C3E9|nr:hypothetical protein [Emergencia timonensis]WNX86898.1 hypothetical protein RVY71_11645 [Emergencia timonensis]
MNHTNDSCWNEHPRRNYQDTVFHMLFSERENAIELFNALEGTDYGPDTEVKFTTLEDAIYAGLKNDLGFIINRKFLVLSEAQSTINNNMPLRQLEYIARTYEKIISVSELYGRCNIQIPTPEFFVIYTGRERWDTCELRLSDSFLDSAPKNSLELVVKIVKMKYNKGENETLDILERSEKLRGYSTLLEYVKQRRDEGCELKEAIDEAVRRCISEGILRDFLKSNSPEVMRMLFNEITSEEFAEIRANEAAKEFYEKGIEKGIEKGAASLIETCKELGLSRAETAEKLVDKLTLSEDTAEAYLIEFWE